MIKNVTDRTYLNTPVKIHIPRKGPATEVTEWMGWLLGGSPIWSIMAAPTEHPNTPQRIHPRHQLTETQPSTQTSETTHDQHLTATPQTQTRYKRKQRVYHYLYCPRCHHRSTWDTWAFSAEKNKSDARFSFRLSPPCHLSRDLWSRESWNSSPVKNQHRWKEAWNSKEN